MNAFNFPDYALFACLFPLFKDLEKINKTIQLTRNVMNDLWLLNRVCKLQKKNHSTNLVLINCVLYFIPSVGHLFVLTSVW